MQPHKHRVISVVVSRQVLDYIKPRAAHGAAGEFVFVCCRPLSAVVVALVVDGAHKVGKRTRDSEALQQQQHDSKCSLSEWKGEELIIIII